MDYSILCEASNKPKTDGYKAVTSADGSDWTSPLIRELRVKP
ncbi:hypothetical protein [Dyadobacter diqingensis]|nr:hypothetical protein [Dyadobacter diqingensis]